MDIEIGPNKKPHLRDQVEFFQVASTSKNHMDFIPLQIKKGRAFYLCAYIHT